MTVTSRTTLTASCLCSLVALTLFGSGCDETGPRVYTGRAYDREAQCLSPDAPIALVEAEDLSATCPPVCFELAETLYVSSVCPPYPADSVLLSSDESTDCERALSAFSEQLECPE